MFKAQIFRSFLFALSVLAFLFSTGCGKGKLLGLASYIGSGGGGGLAAPTSLTYTLQSVTYVNGVAIPDNMPTTNGASVTYSITAGTLPTGLTLNGSTGVISGTPTANVAPSTITVQVSNSSGSTTRDLSIGVQNGWAVDSTGDTGDTDTVDNLCIAWGGGCTLRAAIEQANVTGGTRAITVPAGTIALDIGGVGTLMIGGAGLVSLTITGQGSSSTTISGGVTGVCDGTTDQILAMQSQNASDITLNGLTLANGCTPQDGAIFQHAGSGILTVNDSLIDNNHTTVSGAAAIAVLAGSGVFNRSTFSNNSSTTSGGGLGSIRPVTIADCAFSGNDASVDGGAFWGNNTTTITNSTFSGNTANDSAGALFQDGGTLTISGSTFSSNTAATVAAGALRAQNNSVVSITDSTFNGNTASDGASLSGGAIYFVNTGASSMNRVTFYGNTADFGGAFSQENGTTNITNSTFSENHSILSGGAVTINDGGTGVTVNIRQTTIANNASDAAASGGGLMVSGATGSLTLTQSIVARNTSNSIVYNCMTGGGGTISAGSYNLFDTDNTDCPVNTGGGTPDIQNASVTALASSVANNGGLVRTLAITSSFPGYDAIPSGSCFSALDARSTARPQGGACDIGAFEL